MKRTVILVAFLAALAYTTAAQARLPHSARELRAAHLTHHPLPARVQLTLADRTIHYAAGTLRFLRTHPHAGTLRGRAVIAHNHSWLLRFGGSEHRAALARLAPATPAHMAGWLCIHSREGSWTDEGAPYYGGLQMTYGWMGAVGDAAQLSPLDQMWAAERVSARYGFSSAWMSSQWPMTYPPCAGYF